MTENAMDRMVKPLPSAFGLAAPILDQNAFVRWACSSAVTSSTA